MSEQDIRWIQRFNNYQKALKRLTAAVEIGIYNMSDLEKEGVIQRFEYTYEMAWKTLQDFVIENGYKGERGKQKLIIIHAASIGYINEEQWQEMIHSRNQMAHDYDEEKMNEVIEKIVDRYFHLFIQLETRLQVEKLKRQNLGPQLQMPLDNEGDDE